MKILLMLSINPSHQAPPIKTKAVLEYKVRPARTNIAHPPLLLLLHGVGSNENHLFQLANYLDDDYLIISARAPFVRSEGSYKWYDVDFSTGQPLINAEQAEESRKILLQFIEELKAIHNFDGKQVFVGGFSQGAIMSYSVGLSSPGQVAGIVALGGRMLQEVKPLIPSHGLEDLQTLIIHGKEDHILPIEHARQAKIFLSSKGVPLHYHELEMGHTINDSVIELLNQWLVQVKTTS